MDPLQDLGRSLDYDPSTNPDDVPNVYRTQRYVPTMPVMPPPGAALTHPATSIFRPQAGLGSPSLPLTGHHDPSRVPTPASTNSPSDGSEMNLYDPVTSSYSSTSPIPRPSQAYNLRHSLHRKSPFPWLVPRLRRFKNTATHPLHPQLQVAKTIYPQTTFILPHTLNHGLNNLSCLRHQRHKVVKAVLSTLVHPQATQSPQFLGAKYWDLLP